MICKDRYFHWRFSTHEHFQMLATGFRYWQGNKAWKTAIAQNQLQKRVESQPSNARFVGQFYNLTRIHHSDVILSPKQSIY
jgi:hypothetical protein